MRRKKEDIFYSKVRVLIIAALINGNKNFGELKEIVKTTDGNLSSHINKLERVGFVTTYKRFIGKKPKSTYELTQHGLHEFKKHVQYLDELINRV